MRHISPSLAKIHSFIYENVGFGILTYSRYLPDSQSRQSFVRSTLWRTELRCHERTSYVRSDACPHLCHDSPVSGPIPFEDACLKSASFLSSPLGDRFLFAFRHETKTVLLPPARLTSICTNVDPFLFSFVYFHETYRSDQIGQLIH